MSHDKPVALIYIPWLVMGSVFLCLLLDMQFASAYSFLGFDTLAAYSYEIPEADFVGPLQSQIPPIIKSLSGCRIGIVGHMVPVNRKNGKTSRFLICKDYLGSGWGRLPKMNEWLDVQIRPGGTVTIINEDYVDQRLALACGRFEAGEFFDEKGELLSIYRMTCDCVTEWHGSPLSGSCISVRLK